MVGSEKKTNGSPFGSVEINSRSIVFVMPLSVSINLVLYVLSCGI